MNTTAELTDARELAGDGPAEDERGHRLPLATGRPRDDDRTAAILDATGELLLEVGYDRLRIQDVAERAGAGTGAIYRRWSTKEALIADAIRAFPDPAVEATDDPVADLRALIHHKFEAASRNPDLITGMIAAMRCEEQIADAVQSRFTVRIFERALARVIGEDHPQLGVLAEVPAALVVHRCAFDAGPIDLDELADQFFALIDAAR